MFTARTLLLPLILLASLGAAHAADSWDAAPFTQPARELLQAASAIKRERPTNVVVLLDERSFVFDAQHRVTRTERLMYRVDSPDGVETWAASSARWQPWHQARPVIRARVITTDGHEHQLDQNLLTDAGTRGDSNLVYDDDHTLEGPLPAVAIGAVVEEEITVRDEKPFFPAGEVYREYVGRPVPVLRTRIVIDAPESLPIKHITNLLPNAQIRETRANGRVRWTLEQGAIDEMREMEANLPANSPAWPSVEFSSGASWESVAKVYRDMTESRVRVEDARPLLAGIKSASRGAAALPQSASLETIARIVGRLHREVRYTGVEFGAARLIPEYPSETLRRRFGDCKDKSTLLIAALRASGIDAYLALLSAGDEQDVSADLPGLGMFNHAIVYVPGVNGGKDLWIDATAEYSRVGTLPAQTTDRLALIIREGTRELTLTPAMRSVDNRQVETRAFFLAEYGPARVVETTETHGTIEGEYRTWYAGADTKARIDDLKTYMRDNYRGKELLSYEHTASDDFSKPYSMSIEMKDAPVGFTDLETSAVGVRLADITSRLPEYFDSRLEAVAEGEERDARTADVVFEPFITVWQYRIQPPPGFQPRELPADDVMKIGPARLFSEYKENADGSVNATWTFDSVKGRYTPAETETLVTALRELKGAEMRLIAFDQSAVALRADGDFKGALQANEALVAKYPRKAVHRLRSASALLEAGLGIRAQREALTATRLEPNSALAWKMLGWTLQHDAVGRRFGEGFDRTGAIAAYRKARELEPKNTDIAADLAVLLEHDVNGVRYSPEANLDLAITEYRARRKLLSEGDAKSDEYANNLFYTLLYARRFGELTQALRDSTPSVTQRALLITTVAAERGGPAAIEASRTLVSSEADRRTALASAGNILTRLREYRAAADLIEASTRGQTTTAANTQRIAMLRKTTRVDGRTIEPSDPRGLVLHAFGELFAPDRDPDALRKLLSHRSAALYETLEFGRAQRSIISGLTRQELPVDVGADLLFSNVRVSVEGDDGVGYRVRLRAAGDTQSLYVIKEDDSYRILTIAPKMGPVALMALERVEANDFAGARRWLDWARLEIKASNSEDPLEGPAFARAWTVGVEADMTRARLATALLLADCALGERALPLLRAARDAADQPVDRLSLDLALAKTHLELSQWRDLQEVAGRLVTAVPTSALAFRYQQWAGIQLQQWDAVDAASRERLARLPDDSIAREMLVHSAEARGKFGEIPVIMKPLIDSGRATASDYNQYAWTSLLTQPVSEQAVEAARMAYDETQGRSFAINHTLACVYAASGKPREARDLLLKGMEQVGIEKPDDQAWYGFGLVAEAYGDAESARDYYAHVQKPKKGVIQASSVYALSQARLAALTRR
jgi:transglutaminase-like putative cysteine protease